MAKWLKIKSNKLINLDNVALIERAEYKRYDNVKEISSIIAYMKAETNPYLCSMNIYEVNHQIPTHHADMHERYDIQVAECDTVFNAIIDFFSSSSKVLDLATLQTGIRR